MSFLRNIFPSFEDRVAKINNPEELIQLWKDKEKENNPKDLTIVERRLTELLDNISDLPVLEELCVMMDERTGNCVSQVKEAFRADDDQYVIALGERGVYLKHLIALAESPNISRAALAEHMITKTGDIRPDLIKEGSWTKAIYQTYADYVPLLNYLESRLLEILEEEISRIDDLDVLCGLFDLATIGEGKSEIRNLKSRELITNRICTVINQIDDLEGLKKLNVPKEPRIWETFTNKTESLFLEK